MPRRLAFCLLLVVAVALLPAVAHAQEAAPVPTPTPGPSAPSGSSVDDIANGILGGLGDVLLTTLRQGLPTILGDWLGSTLEALIRGVWDALARVFGPINIFTQMPDLWTYNLPAVGLARQRLVPIAAALVGLGTVLTVLLAGLGTLIGRPFGWALAHAPHLLLAGAGIAAAPQLMSWWIDLMNATSGALLDPVTGLPGLNQLTAVGQLLDIGWVAVLYVAFAGWFLFARLKLLVLAALCVAVAPLAIGVGALPLAPAQHAFRWWLTTFLGVTAVQVLQATCLGIGANVILVGSAHSGGASEIMAGLMGAGSLLAAGSIPKMVLGGLAPETGNMRRTLKRAFYVVAGLGAASAGVATVTQVVGAAGAVRGYGGTYVGSLLGDGPLPLLPAPKD